MITRPGRLLNKKISSNVAKRLLNIAGFGYLSADVEYMFYPNDPSRSDGNRHYLYKDGAWTATGSTIDGTMLTTGAISGGAGTHTITLPAATVSRVQVIWESSLAHVVAFEMGFNRVLTTAEQAAFNSAWMTQLLAGTGLTISGCRVVYTGDGYYVDSANGNDANAGGITAPFKTVAAAVAADTSSNKSALYLSSGSSWREQYVVPRNSMSVVGYGRGAKPLLDCSAVIAAGDFSKTVGQTNVYQASVAVNASTHGGSKWMGVWVDGTRLVYAASVVACDAAPGSYYATDLTSTPVTLYIHAPSSSDPTSDGKVYEYAARSHGVDSFDVTGVTITGVHGKRNRDSYGSICVGRSCTASWCRASEGNSHNIYVRAGASVQDTQADYGYADGTTAPIPFVFFENVALNTHHATFTRCTVIMTAGQSGTGFYCHSGSGTLGVMTVDSCIVTATALIAANAANATSLVVSNGTFNCLIAVKSGINTTVSDCTLNVSAGGSAAFITDAASTTWSISRCTVNNGAVNAGSFFTAAHATTTATLTGNTVTGNSGKGSIYAVRSTQATTVLVATGNTWRCNTGGYHYVFTNTTGMSITSDNNAFTIAGTWTLGANSYTSLADWRTASSQDANSTGW